MPGAVDPAAGARLAFLCSHCGARLRVRRELAGITSACPSCRKAVEAPAVAGADEPPTETFRQPADGSDPVFDAEAAAEKNDLAFLAPPQGPGELGRLGPYRVLKLVGRGAMGVVFQAEDTQLKRLVALKTLRASLATDSESRRRFLREARTAASLDHEHVVPVYAVDEDRGMPYLAMKLLQGESLEQRLNRLDGPMEVGEILRIGKEISAGLDAAHARGLIHRDVKPANVWLESDRDRVRLVDFGLARTADDDATLTSPGMMVGTPAYMAPEQADGGALDARSDLFSLGCVLYRMATGSLPFKGKTTLAVLTALAAKKPAAPRDLVPSTPPGLSDLILQLLSKKAAGRPPSARAVVESLEQIEADLANEVVPELAGDWEQVEEAETPKIADDSRPRRRPRKRRRRKPGVDWERRVIVFGIIVAIGIALLILFLIGKYYYDKATAKPAGSSSNERGTLLAEPLAWRGPAGQECPAHPGETGGSDTPVRPADMAGPGRTSVSGPPFGDRSGLLLFTLIAPPAVADPIEADFVIRGSTLYDGGGEPGVVGDLAIKGGRIVGVGDFRVAGKPRILDGKGLAVAPGFIDLHTHCDALSQAKYHANRNYLFQGVTTVVTGNCGFGATDAGEFFKSLEDGKVGDNVILLAPHNDLRRKAMGAADRPPTETELKRMEELVDKAMRDGAWGVSTGLMYEPGAFAKTDEITALAKVVSRHGGIYATHMRDQGVGVLASIDETLKIGREAGLPVHISHFKASGRKAWGLSADAVALIEKARKDGQAVTADQYPYTANSTKLAALVVPAAFRAGEAKDFVARLDDAEAGPKIRKAVADALDDMEGGKNLRIAAYAPKPMWQGKDVAAIAEMEGRTPLEITLDVLHHGDAQIVGFVMKEDDVRLIMKRPWVATASDGSCQDPADGDVPHPRSYGCFPRKLGRYSVEEKVIPLEQAVRSASGLPADILSLPERGYLKVGNFADVVVFDPETFRDVATFDKPHQYATGVKWLFVNGVATIDDGKYTEALAGKVLRHKSAAADR
jgi:N-acyl-D-aspartate/D-glutamate deacylase/serine/threonine protein kinase